MLSVQKIKTVLVVEDELLIAQTISLYLQKKEYSVVKITTCFEDTVDFLKENKVDIVLIDIALEGEKSGIDLGKFINVEYQIPFVYVTAQQDDHFVSEAKRTKPRGYLTKPIRYQDLYTTLEMIEINSEEDILKISVDKKILELKKRDILFIQSDHVYINIQTTIRKKPFLLRGSLVNILAILDDSRFQQVHRSFIANIKKVESWSYNWLRISEFEIPIGRYKKNEILSVLRHSK
jgi:DNA-binding LytR/AlgR family response regulator